MLLPDYKIKEIGHTLVVPFSADRIQAIGYDLSAEKFYTEKGTEASSFELHPLESVFVQCVETITLPNDITATLQIRNSRIRQGLSISAPQYYPGHRTPVYFRLTNVSGANITLRAGEGFATIIFHELPGSVDQPYNGTFQDEKKYSGMGCYSDHYSESMRLVESKLTKLKEIEQNIFRIFVVFLIIVVFELFLMCRLLG